MVDFSFGQVDALLAGVHHIASDKRQAFSSRLKHLQRQGLPQRAQPGRGRAGTFSVSQLMQMAIGLELIQAGLPPALTAELVSRNWYSLRVTCLLATYNTGELRSLQPPEPTNDWYWIVSPQILADISEGGVQSTDYFEAIDTVSAPKLGDYLVSPQRVHVIGSPNRFLILNATQIIREVMIAAAYSLSLSENKVERMRADLELEIMTERNALDDAVAALPGGGEWSRAVEAAIEIMNLRPVLRWTEKERAAGDAVILGLSTRQREIMPSLIDSFDQADTADLAQLKEIGLIEYDNEILQLSQVGMIVASMLRNSSILDEDD